MYFELENCTWRQHCDLRVLKFLNRRNVYKRTKKKNSCIGKKCRNGVPAFKKAEERRSGASRLNLSTVGVGQINNLSSIVDKLLPLSSELSAGVGVRLPALEVLGQDALAVVQMQQQCLHGRLGEFHAHLQLFVGTRLLSASATRSQYLSVHTIISNND